MKLSRLYIKDFLCIEHGYINFSQFSSALILGKQEGNELSSNGSGKTAIFRAMEYVLFNQTSIALPKIIRDDTTVCHIVLDFFIKDKEYRLSRKRTKKGSTDLSLYVRTEVNGEENQVYHSFINEMEDPLFDKQYWEDISASRTGDTEEDLEKLIKINFKGFRNTVYFKQHDFAGLATATPGPRKMMFKEVLNLVLYQKLEKIAKNKYDIILKDIEKNKILLSSLGDLSSDLLKLEEQLPDIKNNLINYNSILLNNKSDYENKLKIINNLKNDISNLESSFSSLLVKEKSLISEKSKIEFSINEYTNKKNNSSNTAKKIISEIKELKEKHKILSEIDFTQIDLLNEENNLKTAKIAEHKINIKNKNTLLEELKIPLPNDNICKHCRQPTDEKHRQECLAKISQDIENCQNDILNSKKYITELSQDIVTIQKNLTNLINSKKEMDNLLISISSKEKEILDKKTLFEEYSSSLKKYTEELTSKTQELFNIQEQISQSSIEKTKNIKEDLKNHEKELIKINDQISLVNNKISQLNNDLTIINYNIEQKNKDIIKQKELQIILKKLNEEIELYPSVIQGFSSSGIPNLIIKNVLDDLQIESNNLLSKLNPGLQLSFVVEKSKDDGTESDTLDIIYNINGRERDYDGISGAQQVMVSFALKLGLSALLNKMMGSEIKFLLLDEVDQPMDIVRTNAFVDIIKFFQKEFMIMVITHRDKLKDKFNDKILVEQDINLVSRVKVISE